ncbi:unnamed protein product [Mytilus coruscus]|uniref:Homeobox domain-containing protein n=1 Tax=Mytilus coruscus TaxID=42192 RepID=A0A6J8CHV7_MYTCO|nr:unnamed protein product [Mytilus coruscus]
MNDSAFIQLTPSTTLSDVIAATIHDIPVDDDSNSSLEQYLDYSQTTTTQDDSTYSSYPSAIQSSYQTPIKTNGKPALTIQTPGHYFSPAGDSRFNDSLSGLLGSPPPDSPLARNPFFSDLQAVLANDCKASNSLSECLLTTMTTQPHQDVFNREQNLQLRFNSLQGSFPDDIKQLSNFYRYQAAIVETERFRHVQPNNYPDHYKKSLNNHYDSQLHQIMDRVERSLSLLEESHQMKPVVSSVNCIKQRPLLSKKAVRHMEDWYDQHLEHPYPNNIIIDQLAVKGNIQVEQVKKWFANKRNRNNNTRTLTEIARKKRKLAMQHSC